MYWIIYGNSRAKSTEDLLRSVLLFWMVEPLSCRSFHKRDQEIFRTFLSSINIEHCPKYIKKNWHWSLLTSSFGATNRTAICHDAKFESFTKVPSARTFRQVEKTRFSKYIYWWFAFQCFWLISRVILAKAGDFFRPAPSRFPPLLFMFFWRRDPQCFKPNVIKYYHRINKSTLKNRFFSERLKIAQNTAKIDADL